MTIHVILKIVSVNAIFESTFYFNDIYNWNSDHHYQIISKFEKKEQLIHNMVSINNEPMLTPTLAKWTSISSHTHTVKSVNAINTCSIIETRVIMTLIDIHLRENVQLSIYSNTLYFINFNLVVHPYSN